MRQSLRCPKCAHTTILHVSQVADVLGDSVDCEPTAAPASSRKLPSVPWRIARTPAYSPSSTMQPVCGLVQAFVCRACGYTELYTADPEQIPVDGVIVRMLRGQGPGPFR